MFNEDANLGGHFAAGRPHGKNWRRSFKGLQKKENSTAVALGDSGAHVLVHYGRSGEEAESVVTAIEAKGGRANAISADLGISNGAAMLSEQVRSIVGDRLDVLVSNAGISKAALIADYTVEDFDNLFAVNVRSPFFLIQQLLPVLGEGSNIIVISSAVARTVVGNPGVEKLSILAYASTKEHLKHWSGTGPRFSVRAAYA